MEPRKKEPIKVKVHDKRRAVAPAPSSSQAETSDTGSRSGGRAESDARVSDISANAPLEGAGAPPETDAPQEAERDFLDDLKRLQADFDNYRKRVTREQESVRARATAGVVDALLPVLDNFERAISHGEGGEGVELVFKELRATLEREGLEEILAEGAEFDPNIHDAIESREHDGIETTTVLEVFRRGYMFKGLLLRPAMVVVGRPREQISDDVEE